MSQDRVSSLLAAYFTRPYDEYGEVALEIKSNGGLSPEEIRLIEDQVLCIDAKAMIRHAGASDK